MTKTFSSKSNAKRAALAALGTGAVEAEDFKVSLGADGKWRWTALTKAAGESGSAKSAGGTPLRPTPRRARTALAAARAGPTASSLG